MNNDFAIEYAVMMPSGELFQQQPQQTGPSDYWAIPSPVRDMLGLTEPRTVGPPTVAIFNDRRLAQAALKALSETAAQLGVTNYGGSVVQRMCTPFTHDPITEFAGQVTEWLQTNGAGE